MMWEDPVYFKNSTLTPDYDTTVFAWYKDDTNTNIEITGDTASRLERYSKAGFKAVRSDCFYLNYIQNRLFVVKK